MKNNTSAIPAIMPDWIDTGITAISLQATPSDVIRALQVESPGLREFAILISDAADKFLEPMAQKAQAITKRHFGNTMTLYTPLYLSNYCNGGCAYCGFAADRKLYRNRLEKDELIREMKALKEKGLENILLLTGEKVPQADFNYLRNCTKLAAGYFHNITIEAFGMTTDEYRKLAESGCTGITLYQETYNPELYLKLHRWGEKRDYNFRINAPDRALTAGMRTVGMGALLGLDNPTSEMLSLFQHIRFLQKKHWQAGFSVSFPRIRHQLGEFTPDYEVTDKQLARIIFAFRICMPDIDLVLSTRENEKLRDGLAGIGISRMSVASKTTVGGYTNHEKSGNVGQFDVSDKRDIEEFCAMLRKKGLEPVFKNWDAVLSEVSESTTSTKQ